MDEATRTLWVDPLHHDPFRDGPPYFPGHPGGKIASMLHPRSFNRLYARTLLKRTAAEMGVDLSVAFEHCLSEYGGSPSAELAVLLASLRAEAMIHQAHHWQTRGQTYYGDHQLFDRVYTTVSGFIDGLAEKAIGTGHHINVQPLLQISQIVAFSKIFYSDAPVNPTPEDYVLLSLRAVLKSSVVLTFAYKSLEGKGQLSYGIDNHLQGIADKQEELIYLLKQRSKTREASVHSPEDTSWKR
jgi:hypothetical protein